MSERDVGVVIVAGGNSTRTQAAGAGELKQLRWVAGKPMLLHSLQTFQARADVAMVVCVLPQRYAGDPPPWLFQCDLDRMLIAPGGKVRAQSVFNGLEDLPSECRYVLIHDAARPLATPEMIDPLKEVDADGWIVRTVARENLWRAQTPQGFPREVIVRAHLDARAAGVDATDDAALCERIGVPVVVVRGSERAMKVTDESDFTRAEALFPLSE